MQLSPSALWVLVLPGCPSLLTYLPLWPVAVFLSSFPPSPPQEYIRHKLEEEQRQLEILQQQLLQEQALLLVQTLGHLPPPPPGPQGQVPGPAQVVGRSPEPFPWVWGLGLPLGGSERFTLFLSPTGVQAEAAGGAATVRAPPATAAAGTCLPEVPSAATATS